MTDCQHNMAAYLLSVWKQSLACKNLLDTVCKVPHSRHTINRLLQYNTVDNGDDARSSQKLALGSSMLELW